MNAQQKADLERIALIIVGVIFTTVQFIAAQLYKLSLTISAAARTQATSFNDKVSDLENRKAA